MTSASSVEELTANHGEGLVPGDVHMVRAERVLGDARGGAGRNPHRAGRRADHAGKDGDGVPGTSAERSTRFQSGGAGLARNGTTLGGGQAASNL